MSLSDFLQTFANPPKEFSLMPFWFWNDTLSEKEILRQIADFEAHGVYGFVIHPRMGLPKTQAWMSEALLGFMRVATLEAKRRGMRVILYDEGMYPSGSSCGQVVAANPEFAARCLDKVLIPQGSSPDFPKSWNLIARAQGPEGAFAVIDRPSGGVIRGLHYVDEDSSIEELPPAADILNPEAAASFIRHVYDRFAKEFGNEFGRTIMGIFTDEPNPVGRDVPALPGTKGILVEVNRILGYDFAPFLPDLFYERNAESLKRRQDYHRAVMRRLEETFFAPLSRWCEKHGLALMGHPGESTDIGMEKYFHIPGQDVVWRWVLPGKTSLEGPHATAAKCASSAMIHHKRRRNSNEIYGAYGHELSEDEMRWLASWCLVRGQNLLIPHAFYYSIRGPRFDERPPDVGPNAAWWPDYKSFADFCRRLSWLNTDSVHLAKVAILASSTELPERAAKICYENQWDFNYLESRHLGNDVVVDEQGLHIAGMHYQVLMVDGDCGTESLGEKSKSILARLAKSSRLVFFQSKANVAGEWAKGAGFAETSYELLGSLDSKADKALNLEKAFPGLRVRHFEKDGIRLALLFNEGSEDFNGEIIFCGKKDFALLDPFVGKMVSRPEGSLQIKSHEMKVLLDESRI
ncbi:MAG: hypothetical protein JNM63_08035 [Spirochaetia bacterium]|nr:hypothetical protein [Spirochaetia bacterium]